MRRRCALCIAVALLTACSQASPTDRPAGSSAEPGATDPSPVDASSEPESPNAEPGTVDIVFDYGPGTFNLLAPASQLADLSAYRSTLIMSFTGTESGQPSEWSNTYEMITSGDPAARQLTFTSPSGDGQDAQAPVYRAEIGGIAYEKRGEAGCTSGGIIDGDSLVRWEPATFLPGVTGAVESGRETVNGVLAVRYDFDERAFGSLPESTSTGQMWVAADGGFVVRYTLTTLGTSEYFGENGEGTLTFDYQLTDVNTAPPIALSADCADGTTDAPLLPDAADVVRVPGLVSYTTSVTADEAVAFYQEQLTAQGWNPVGDPTVGEIGTVQTFQRAPDELVVVVRGGEAGTTVRLVPGFIAPDE